VQVCVVFHLALSGAQDVVSWSELSAASACTLTLA